MNIIHVLIHKICLINNTINNNNIFYFKRQPDHNSKKTTKYNEKTIAFTTNLHDDVTLNVKPQISIDTKSYCITIAVK